VQTAVVPLDRAVFGVQRLPEHGPAAVDGADPVSVVDADVVVEGDVGGSPSTVRIGWISTPGEPSGTRNMVRL